MKRKLKGICYLLALGLAMPFAMAERILRGLCGRDVWFPAHAEGLSLLPGRVGHFVRNAYYHLTLQRCPWDCYFGFGTLLSHSEAEIGERVYLGAHCMIGLATIGDDTMLADHVYLVSGKHQHGTSDPAVRFQDQPQTFTRIRIGRNCWLGVNTVVMADVGDNCLIGAGSVVTREIPDNSVAVGNPARVIRNTFPLAAVK